MKKADEKELEVLLEEYKARRNEIDQTLNGAFNTTNITLIGVSATLSAASFIFDAGLTGIYAVFAMVFYIISLIQLRYILQVWKLSNYIKTIIAPNVRRKFKQNNEKKDEHNHIMSWEYQGRKKTHNNLGWSLPIEAARYGLPIIAGVVSTLAFYLSQEKSGFEQWVNIGLLIGNVILFVYTIYAVIKTRNTLKS